MTDVPQGPPLHPLDPLGEEEIVTAAGLTRAALELDDRARFVVITLAEPAKAELAAWQPGTTWDRRAEVVLFPGGGRPLVEVLVSLSAGALVSSREAPGACPVLLFGETFEAFLAVKADPRWQEAVRRRGVTDLDAVQVDPWPAGNFGRPGEEGRRLVRCVSYARDSNDDNGYAHPLEGLVASVDLDTMTVLEVIDEDPGFGIPPHPGRYGPDDVGPVRTDLKALEITQPDGPSFSVEGWEVRWQRWSLRFSVHPVEGLVLHQVAYDGRPVLHRASIAEMVVPYGDVATNHWWKNAFDAGEWGLGRMIQPLTNGCDCLGEIRYADAVFVDESGGASRVSNAVCMHEEDVGILWKHVDLWSGTSAVRRSRRFVISTIATVGNYEYGFYWCFYLDGSIQLDVKLTGILQTSAVAAGDTDPAHAVLIAPQLAAPHHQHLFCARLDVDVDGTANSVYEIDTRGAPDAGPEGNAIVATATLLASESAAQREIDPGAARCWRIESAEATNGLGRPTAYRLIPAAVPTLLAAPSAAVNRRAAFATHNLWVTPHAEDERRPAGDHPNQSGGGDGLPAWTAADRPLVATDVVVWHTFGVTHVARPEEWPVMPVEATGFWLRPDGFFDRNPALDVPPPHACHT